MGLEAIALAKLGLMTKIKIFLGLGLMYFATLDRNKTLILEKL